METIQEKKFRVSNIDCAACADKIERVLKKTEGVEAAVVDFNLTLHLKAADISKALAAVARIEPDVKIEPTLQDSKADAHESRQVGNFQKQVGIIVIAGIILAIHLFFEDKLHQRPWAWVEYSVRDCRILAGRLTF